MAIKPALVLLNDKDINMIIIYSNDNKLAVFMKVKVKKALHNWSNSRWP